MSRALHAEWTKQRTVAGTGWLLLGAIALTVALSVVVALATTYASAGRGQDLAKLSLTGVYLGQSIVAILAVLTITGEYSSRVIQITLTAIPHRPTVLAAKAAVPGALVPGAGTVAVLGCVLAAGRAAQPGDRRRRARFRGRNRTRARPAPCVPDLRPSRDQPEPGAPARADRADDRRARDPGTTNLRSLPIAPWVGLGVLAAWAAAALAGGGLLLTLRDA